MPNQWAQVPIELVELVDAAALQVYVALCKFAGRQGHTYVLNPKLSETTGQSVAAVGRSLKQLADVGAIIRNGRQRRVIVVVPVARLSLPCDRKTGGSIAHPRATYRSPVSDIPRCIYPEDTPSLRSGVPTQPDESEPHMQAEPEQPLFDVDPTSVVRHETPIGHAALKALLDAYGTEPISRPMIGRLGKRFKELAETYTRDELLAAAESMGARRVANPNAIEAFVLRSRQPAQQSREGWSALAADTYAQLPDPFTGTGSV